ncbi:MAG: ribosome biogenesis GTP-binding protein YihA/YsxC [Clostridia bacterium]|nr:ribosome biogenesis GTP-binding protein YihA/YsxC [Clostridia bacterium]
MKIKTSKFIITVAESDKILETNLKEVAFVGRSNAGKSSLINALTNKNALAKTSSTPGKTKHINYFLINDEFYIVDLPGYGYHNASKADEQRWTQLIEDYLLKSKRLTCVFVLMDIRHKPSLLDKQMLTFLHYYSVPFVIIATKADKLSKSQRFNYAHSLANAVGLTGRDVIISSSQQKFGMEQILEKCDQFLGQDGLDE